MRTLSLMLFVITLAVAQSDRPVPPPPSSPADEAVPSMETLLGTRVVTASRLPGDLSAAPGVMRVVTRDELARFAGLTLREVLNRVAGLSWTPEAFTDRSIIAARGDRSEATGGHILYLINGRPTRSILESGVNSELLEAFPIGILERIEVIEGPGSVLYGSNAFSAVINLITRTEYGKTGALRSFGGGNAAAGGSAEGFYRRGDFHISSAVQFHKINEGVTGISVLPGATRLLLPLYNNSRGVFAEAGFKGFSAEIASMEWRAPYAIGDSVAENRWRRTFADIGYDGKAATHWDSGIHASYTWTGLVASGPPSITRRSGEVELNWTNSVAVTERTTVAFGTIFSYQYGRELYPGVAGPVVATDASLSGMGLYAQVEHQLTDDLKLIGGFQTNKIGALSIDTVPRVGVTWKPSTHWYAKGLYGQAFRAPSLNEMQIQSPYIRGNANLLAETATTFDILVGYQRRQARSNVSYFHSRLSNLINPLPSGSAGTQYQNTGTLFIKGVQWDAKAYVGSCWLVEGSVMYQKPSNKDPANKDPANKDPAGPALPVAPLSIKAGLSYSERHGWTLSVFDIYSGLVPAFTALPNPKPSAHQLLSAHVQLALEKYLGPVARHVAAFAHGDNLFNRAIWQATTGTGFETTLPVQRGRTIYYGLEFSVKRE